jgi:hypothetical protein
MQSTSDTQRLGSSRSLWSLLQMLPTGLDEPVAQARRDFGRLNFPAPNWVPAVVGPDGRTMLDVLIIGAGLCGQTAAFALGREGIRNVRTVDRAERGREGPWGTYARMDTLRSPKHLTGPDLGFPALTRKVVLAGGRDGSGAAEPPSFPSLAGDRPGQYARVFDSSDGIDFACLEGGKIGILLPAPPRSTMPPWLWRLVRPSAPVRASRAPAADQQVEMDNICRVLSGLSAAR